MKKKARIESVSLSQIGEFGLIDIFRKHVQNSKDVICGIGDDAAILPLNTKKDLLITTDMVVEGRHFTLKDDFKLIGRKALGVNISDIAAMGGISRFAIVTIGISSKTSLGLVKEIYKGIEALARSFDISIVGGDTVCSDRLLINISLLGEVDRKKAILRSGAKAGDKIFVTGPIGNSFKNKKHLNFTPRQKEASILSRFFRPTAMIDISDGLVADLAHILRQSYEKGAILDVRSIPLNPDASLSQALYDGEDFELIFTASLPIAKKLEDQRKVKCYCIGNIIDRPSGIYSKDLKGNLRNINIKGYCHF